MEFPAIGLIFTIMIASAHVTIILQMDANVWKILSIIHMQTTILFRECIDPWKGKMAKGLFPIM
jgi:hypothetical protein